ncbi:MAG: hypothetical protein JW940_22050 [Polyangiaceae bacterium]|nr:hypothetical protein [Polyangiaceae bacterium]
MNPRRLMKGALLLALLTRFVFACSRSDETSEVEGTGGAAGDGSGGFASPSGGGFAYPWRSTIGRWSQLHRDERWRTDDGRRRYRCGHRRGG